MGVSAETSPRHEEHDRFLAWLLEQITTLKVDVLVVAGDIFHYTQPSAAAQSQFFDFIASCSRIDHLDVVIVAGNHDSPSRLDAPGMVLKSLRVHVVGNLPEKLEDAIIPIRRGEKSVVVVAVPYVSESKLGVVTTDRKPSEIKAIYAAKFRELYQGLADLSKQKYGEVPRVATGHLTCVGQEGLKEGDYQTPIHQSMTITGLSSEIFGDDYAYVALGHIHRPHRVSEGVYYSGTPVATNVTEAFEPRKVMLLDETGHVEALPVPIWRESFVLRDDAHTLHDLLCELRWSSELPPYVYLEVDGDGGGPEEFQKLLAREFPKSTPRIASFKRASFSPTGAEVVVEARDLHTYTPEEVFELFWTRRFGEDVGPSERAAFHELLAEVLGDEG